MVGVVPTLQCIMVMYGLGILAIDRLKESCQPIMGNVPFGNDVLKCYNRKRTYTRKRRSKKSMLCHGCKKSFTYKKRLLTHKQTCAGMKRLIDRALMSLFLASDPASNPNSIEYLTTTMAQFHRLSFCVGVKKLFHIKLKCPSNIILSVVVNGHGVHTVTIFQVFMCHG